MRSGVLLLGTIAVASAAIVAVACGEDNLGIVRPEISDGSFLEGSTPPLDAGADGAPVVPTHTVGGGVTGLDAAKSVVLTLGTDNDVTVSANGSFTFPKGVAEGQPYAVTVKTQPNLQRCVVTNGTGTMGTTNVTNVVVDCFIDLLLSIGGNETTFIENALVQMPEPFTKVPVDAGASSWGAAPSSGIFITSNDNDDLVFPTNWQTFLDAGGHILMIGGGNTAQFRTFIGAFVTVDATSTWHASDDCTSDWNKIGTHPATTMMPATFEFPNPSTTFHMAHFPAAGQPTGTVLLGETCHTAGNDAIYALRTYASGGTFAYLAFNLGKFIATGTTPGFTVPFLQSYLAYVRSKK